METMETTPSQISRSVFATMSELRPRRSRNKVSMVKDPSTTTMDDLNAGYHPVMMSDPGAAPEPPLKTTATKTPEPKRHRRNMEHTTYEVNTLMSPCVPLRNDHDQPRDSF
jgi:hypothetical protein